MSGDDGKVISIKQFQKGKYLIDPDEFPPGEAGITVSENIAELYKKADVFGTIKYEKKEKKIRKFKEYKSGDLTARLYPIKTSFDFPFLNRIEIEYENKVVFNGCPYMNDLSTQAAFLCEKTMGWQIELEKVVRSQ